MTNINEKLINFSIQKRRRLERGGIGLVSDWEDMDELSDILRSWDVTMAQEIADEIINELDIKYYENEEYKLKAGKCKYIPLDFLLSKETCISCIYTRIISKEGEQRDCNLCPTYLVTGKKCGKYLKVLTPNIDIKVLRRREEWKVTFEDIAKFRALLEDK